MSVSVTSWGNAQAPAYTANPQPPPTVSLPVQVANTAGHWLIACCAWRQAVAGAGVSVSVGDDVHNWWDPAGAPSGDSLAAGVTRAAVWAAPAARAAEWVMCAPSGSVQGTAMTVLDVSGMAPWYELRWLQTASATAATSLSLASVSPGTQVLLVTCLASDNSSAVIFGPGTGWTSLPLQSASNGIDHSADIRVDAAWMVTTAAQAAAWTATAATDLAGVIAAFAVSPSAPVAPNPSWPIVVTEIAPGAGVQTPPSQLGWQRVSGRALGLHVTQGAPYSLGGVQAAQGTLSLDDPDGSLIPPGNGVFAGLDSGTPIRQRAAWPASTTPHNVTFSGYLQQLPPSLDPDLLRGQVEATVTDAIGYATRSLPPALLTELLSDGPYALWPLNDPAGSIQGSNIAPGNANPLTVAAGKFGVVGTAYTFGTGTSNLKGFAGTGMWSQTGVPSTGLQGYSLGCTDSNYPSITGGVTLEGWFAASSTTPGTFDVLTAQNSLNNILECQVQSGGNLQVIGSQNPSNSTTVTLTTLNFGTAPLWHLAVAFNRTTYSIYVNGMLAASGTWTFRLPAAFTAVWANGNWSPLGKAFGKLYNGFTAAVMVTPGLLAPNRVQAHYQAGATAYQGDPPHLRIERLLAATGLTGRRVIEQDVSPDVTHMASMATIGGTPAPTQAPGTPGYTPGTGTTAGSALVNTATSTAPGFLTMAPTGDVWYRARAYAWNQAPRWVLGDNTAGGEIPFLVASTLGYDPSLVRNDVQITQPDTGAVIVPNLATASLAASQAQYGDQSYQPTAMLQHGAEGNIGTAAGMQDLANWVVATGLRPGLRAASIIIDAATRPASWPFVLGAAPGDMVTVNLRPPTMPGTVISLAGRLTETDRDLEFAADAVRGQITCAIDFASEQDMLTVGDSVRGQLTGTNLLGW